MRTMRQRVRGEHCGQKELNVYRPRNRTEDEALS